MTVQSDTVAAKGALRATITARRRALDVEARDTARAAVRETVLARAARAAETARPWRQVFAYDPLPSEPGSPRLLDELARFATVHVPYLLPNLDLDWQVWGDDRRLGVECIADADAVLVPALCVDQRGMRLGRGGGSYDRVLARVPDTAVLVALLHCGEVVADVPAQPWDRPVRAAATPDGWFELAG